MENFKKLQEEKEYWNETAMDLLDTNKKLEADKAELLKELEEMYSKYEKDGHLLNVSPSKIISLVQKMKK